MSEAQMRRCPVCQRYTLAPSCVAGHGATGSPHPARYSPQDRWARYRRALYEEAAKGAVPGGP